MMKTACFLRRCRAPLASAALLVAGGCNTLQPNAGAGTGSPRAGDTPTPDPDTTGPHPIYIINDGAAAADLAGMKPGLIVNLKAATDHRGEDAGVVDSYEVPAGSGQSVRTTGPHPIIQINLPVETAAAPGTRVRVKAATDPRTVVVVMGDKNTITHGAGRRTIVVHLALPLQHGETCPLPAATPVASATRRRQADAR